MVSEKEHIQHETLKALLKQAVQCNQNLTIQQKQLAAMRIDKAAEQADWIMEMLRLCGYLQ